MPCRINFSPYPLVGGCLFCLITLDLKTLFTPFSSICQKTGKYIKI